MKIHLTNSSPSESVYEVLKLHPQTLLSFAYANLEHKYVSTWIDRPREIILDSGAFTAWSAGKQVKVRDYADWVIGFNQRHGGKLERVRVINLDRIPGVKGRTATADEIAAAAIESQQNADYLYSRGLSPIEVFHQDEPFDLLPELVTRSHRQQDPRPIIALSPRNDVSTKERGKWLDRTLKYCLQTFGKDNLPAAHGLAVTTPKLCNAYPFYSVDSSTWTQCLRFGVSRISGLPRLPRTGTAGYHEVYVHALKCELVKYQQLAMDSTKLWKNRGIVWDE